MVRSYICIDDLCAVIARLITARAAGVVDVGSGVGHSALDVVRTVEQIVARPVGLEFAPARAVDVSRIVLDASGTAALGAPPVRPLADGVRLFARDLGFINA